MSKLKIAVCQYSLSGEISDNLAQSIKQIKVGASKGTDIIHFPECNLSAYVGVEFTEYNEYRWLAPKKALKEIIDIAAKLKLWIIVGRYWFERGMNLPYNSLFVINSDGKLSTGMTIGC